MQGCWARSPPPRAAARTCPPSQARGRGQVEVGQSSSSGSSVYVYWYWMSCALLQKLNNDSKLTTLFVLDLVMPRGTLPRRVSLHRVLSSSQEHRVVASC